MGYFIFVTIYSLFTLNYFSTITSYSPPPPSHLQSIHSRHHDTLGATEMPTIIFAFLLFVGFDIKLENASTNLCSDLVFLQAIKLFSGTVAGELKCQVLFLDTVSVEP
jgi:hypothetical protein